MKYNPKEPYNELPLLPPKEEIESKEVMRKAISASRYLAELKGRANEIPNPSILINTITLREALDSSEIENIFTTTDNLYKAFSADVKSVDKNTKEVLRYRQALWDGFNLLKKRPLSTNVFIKIVQQIKENDAGIRNTPGTKVENSKTGEIIYTPPDGEELIRNLLSNFEKFLHSNDKVDPLIKLALSHYQFEAIHPFYDGNGRTGRIINILFLIEQRLLDLPILFLSKFIIENKGIYYEKLRAVTEKRNFEDWILYMLKGVEETAIYTIRKIEDIRNLMNETINLAKEKLPSRVYSKELIELLFDQPYCKVKFVVNAGIAKRQTAAEYLKELENIGILKSEKVGLETLYLNMKLYDLLEK
jgi:Fic family protein